MPLAFLSIILSFFLKSLGLYISVSILILSIYFYRFGVIKKYLIVVILIYLSSIPFNVGSKQRGVVVSIEDKSYKVWTFTHLTTLITKEKIELDTYVVFEGEARINLKSYKKNFTTYFNPQISNIVKLPSIKRFLWQRLKNNTKAREILFSIYPKDDSLISSRSWYLSGFILIVEWLFRPKFGLKRLRKVTRMLVVAYYLLISPSINVLRLILSRFLNKPLQITVLIILFPQITSSPFFWLVYGEWVITSMHSKLKKYKKLIRLMIISKSIGYLDMLNLFGNRFMKVYAGLKFIKSLIAILFPSFPINRGLFNALIAKEVTTKLKIMINLPLIVIIMVIILLMRYQKIAYTLLISTGILLYVRPFATVTFIDVGQGDATLIRYAYRASTQLIDTGKPSSYHNLEKTLRNLGVKHLDSLIITHDDMDHSGNVKQVIKDFNPSKIILTKEQSIEGMETFLADRYFKDINENSLIMKSDLGVLFTGDASILQEWLLSKDIKTQSLILKLGHHGSKTSSSMAFLKHVHPKLAIISADPSTYGHPHAEVLANLYNLGIPYLSTFQDGNIKLYFVGNMVFFTTDSGKFGWL